MDRQILVFFCIEDPWQQHCIPSKQFGGQNLHAASQPKDGNQKIYFKSK